MVSSYWQMPVPAQDDRILGGVAAGVAREVGIDVLWIRLAFLVLFAIGGWGALMYLVAWGAMAQVEYLGRGTVTVPVVKARTRPRRLAGVALITIGLIVFFAGQPGVGAEVMWPLGVVGAGMLIAWRQLAPGRQVDGLPRSVRLAGGLLLALGGIALLLNWAVGPDGGNVGVFAGIGVGAGLIGLSAPWWWRMVQDLDNERKARIRSDERAEVAAHLHDSVLQTLTLIQKQGEDPLAMRNLARRQERELRNWLDPDRADRTGSSVRGHLDELATAIEELHGVPVEIVSVGDCIVTEPVAAALSAAKEAAVNAAKHSGADRVDIYAEIGDRKIEFFVRDTGVGFDPALVAADRRGISESIEGRMERVGGAATIISDVGAGTEVEISVPRPADPQPPPRGADV
ncbi:MAG: signal transduction histidine kinase [Acidimicrobiales bacterium]|jgi:signal transduction histidine kinase